MTYSPEVTVRLAIGSAFEALVLPMPGNGGSRAAVQSSDALLGDGGLKPLITGHAHGAQILEAPILTGKSLGCTKSEAARIAVQKARNFISRDFHRQYLRK